MASHQGHAITRRPAGPIPRPQPRPARLFSVSSMSARQWRSLEERAGDPAFLERVAQEFPQLQEMLAAPHDRRQILRLLGAAMAMGGLAACTSGEPSGVLIPAVRVPPGLVPGQPNHYATAHVHAGYAL